MLLHISWVSCLLQQAYAEQWGVETIAVSVSSYVNVAHAHASHGGALLLEKLGFDSVIEFGDDLLLFQQAMELHTKTRTRLANLTRDYNRESCLDYLL